MRVSVCSRTSCSVFIHEITIGVTDVGYESKIVYKL